VNIYVDLETKLLCVEHTHNGREVTSRYTREEALKMVNALIRGLEELAIIRSQL